jgi:integrase/recombinase XerD
LLDEVAAIQKWLKERPRNDSPFLFISRKRGALHITGFFRIFQTIAEKAGVSAYKRHPRILKYSLAAHLLSRNVDLAVLNQLLGHRSFDTTLKYVKTTDQQAAVAARSAITEIFRDTESGRNSAAPSRMVQRKEQTIASKKLTVKATEGM